MIGQENLAATAINEQDVVQYNCNYINLHNIANTMEKPLP